MERTVPVVRPIRWMTAAVVVVMLGAAPSAHALSGMAMKSLCARVPTAVANPGAAAKKAAGDAAFAARKDVAKAKVAISNYEAALAADPRDVKTRMRLSRTYYLLGDGHYRFEEEDDAQLDAFLKGAHHAGIAVALTAPRFVR